MDQNEMLKINNRIEQASQEMIYLQEELTKIPAIAPESGGQGEWKKMLFVKKYIEDMGLSVREYHAPDKNADNDVRPNITALLKGKNSSKTLWILSHLDIVPPGELKLWDRDPYTLKVEGDKLYGRGTEDNQQDLAASLICIKAFWEEKVTPEVNLGVAIVSDEETGSEFGLRYLLANHTIFQKEDLILAPDSGNNTGDIIEVAEKTMLWLKFETKGKQCHASTPKEGNNSFRAASHLVVQLDSLYQKFSNSNPLFRPSISTFEPTKKESNVDNINTVPGDDVFYIDCRVLPEYNFKEIMNEIHSICRKVESQFHVSINCSPVIRDDAASETPSDAPVVNALKAALREVGGIEGKTVGIGGGTVASHLRKADFHTAVWSKIAHTAHQPNEYCLLGNMIFDAKVFAHMAMQNV